MFEFNWNDFKDYLIHTELKIRLFIDKVIYED
jgi:hypothetical protein